MGKDISKMKEIHACTPTQGQPYTMNFATKSKHQVAWKPSQKTMAVKP